MTKAVNCAIRFLSRREYSAYELKEKLLSKGFNIQDVNVALEHCRSLDLQSDARFAESICRIRIRQGFGPLRITHELCQKQVDRTIIDKVLREEENNWLNYGLKVWDKKNSSTGQLSLIEVQKRKRFLLYRGFSIELISQIIREKLIHKELEK